MMERLIGIDGRTVNPLPDDPLPFTSPTQSPFNPNKKTLDRHAASQPAMTKPRKAYLSLIKKRGGQIPLLNLRSSVFVIPHH